MNRWIKLNGPLVLLALAVFTGFICYGFTSGTLIEVVLPIIGIAVTGLITGLLLGFLFEKRRDLLLAEMKSVRLRRNRKQRTGRWLRNRSRRNSPSDD